MTDKMREAMINQDGAVWEKIGGAWSLYKPAQSVPVVGEPWRYVVNKSDGTPLLSVCSKEEADKYRAREGLVVFPVFREPTHSITAAELATLREKAAQLEQVEKERDEANARLHDVSVACATAEQERDELQKRAERMQKALSDIAEWTDRYTTPGHPVSTIARAAIAQEGSDAGYLLVLP